MCSGLSKEDEQVGVVPETVVEVDFDHSKLNFGGNIFSIVNSSDSWIELFETFQNDIRVSGDISRITGKMNLMEYKLRTGQEPKVLWQNALTCQARGPQF